MLQLFSPSPPKAAHRAAQMSFSLVLFFGCAPNKIRENCICNSDGVRVLPADTLAHPADLLLLPGL